MTTDGTSRRTDGRAGAGAAQRTRSSREPDPPERRPTVAGRPGKALFAWWQHTRPTRANARFGARGGGVLTGGIAYAALFSVFAALTIGYTIFMAVLGDNDELRAAGAGRGRRRRCPASSTPATAAG